MHINIFFNAAFTSFSMECLTLFIFSFTSSLLSLQITMSSVNIFVHVDFCQISSVNLCIVSKKRLKADR